MWTMGQVNSLKRLIMNIPIQSDGPGPGEEASLA